MPIYDTGYRHWAGQWTSHPYRWWVITRQGLGLLLHRRRFVLLMVLSAIPFVVRAVMIYAATILGHRLPVLRIDAAFFEDFLSQQLFFVFIISIYAGAGQIANDMRANALQIYLSKPITRLDYIMGKLGIVVFFLSLPTLIPALVLLLLAFLFHSDSAFLQANYWIAAPILAYSLLIVFAHGFIILALSAMSRSSRFAGINFAAVIFFSQILFGISSGIFRSSKYAWVSVPGNLTQLGEFLFRVEPKYASPIWASALALAILLLSAAWIVFRKVQAVEVVT